MGYTNHAVETNTSPPHWFESDMGHIKAWRVFRYCSDGYVVIGYGASSEQCLEDVQKLVDERERYLRLSEIDRLKALLDKNQTLLSTPMDEAIRLLSKIVLDHVEAHK